MKIESILSNEGSRPTPQYREGSKREHIAKMQKRQGAGGVGKKGGSGASTMNKRGAISEHNYVYTMRWGTRFFKIVDLLCFGFVCLCVCLFVLSLCFFLCFLVS